MYICKFCGTAPNTSTPEICDFIDEAFRCPWMDARTLKRLKDNYEPPDPMRGVEFPFAENH